MPEPSPPPTSSGEPRGADSGSAGGAVLPLVPGLERRPAKHRPLPDAAAVRLLGVPDSAPPYDDSLAEAGSRGRRGEARPHQPALQPERPKAPTAQHERSPQRETSPEPEPGPRRGTTPPRETSPEPEPSPRRGTTPQRAPAPRTEPAERAAQHRLSPPSGPHPRRRPAAAAAWPSRFAQVLAETLAGSRPQDQIRPWTSEQARRRIRQLGPRLAAEVQPRVRRVMTSRPATGVVEMTVIVGFGPRTRVLAVRLECAEPPHPDATPSGRPATVPAPPRWICTAIEAA